MSKQLFVLFTMDVEPSATDNGVSGPASDEAGMNSVKIYQDVLKSRGYRATYFVHPELVHAYPEFYKNLVNDGNSLGLHLHTTKFSADKQGCELGGLTADQQRRVIEKAIQMFEKGIGHPPLLFRPGCFSANDATFSVLCKLGFEGGGISIPGRVWPERFCVWSGAHPYAHFANEAFRQSVGKLPFVNIPLSVDLTTELCFNPVGFLHYPDLRPGGVYSENDEIEQDRGLMLHNILQKMATDDPPVKTLVIDVHNDRDFTGEDSQASSHLRTVLERIEPECRDLGWKVVPATYKEVVRDFAKFSA